MTTIHVEGYRCADGRDFQLTFAQPDGVVRGGLVVLHAANGVTDRLRWLISALADEGWLTVAPHLFEEDQANPTQANPTQTAQDNVLEATDATLAWLKKQGVRDDLLGVVGFDLGGTAALMVASVRTLGAVVSVGGQGGTELPRLIEIASKVASPWLGLYGDAGDDLGKSEVEQLRDASAKAEVATEVVRYPGARHRFDADPKAAAEAWQRTLNWFDANLR